MSEQLLGEVINLNAYGATVRLETGDLASAPAGDVDAHRTLYERAHANRKRLTFLMHGGGRRPMVVLAPQIDEPELEEQIAHYFKSTQSWETDADGVPIHERHFLQKKRRAAAFKPRE